MTKGTSSEHPILFSGPMVRAILESRKTQTRRPIKGAPLGADCGLFAKDSAVFFRGTTPESPSVGAPIRCPYGVPGDRLWVRETWQDWCPTWSGGRTHRPAYRATPDERGEPLRWRPSIHMPRWASRITLELTGVRVERLQAIDEAGAICEGFMYAGRGDDWQRPDSFRVLWDRLNSPRGYGWDMNPWIWVLEFRLA